MAPYLSGFFYEGAKQACNTQEKQLLFDACENSWKQEKQALRQMFLNNVDAVVYWPGVKPSEQFTFRRLRQECNDVAAQLPFICVGNCQYIDSAYQLCYRAEEAGRLAAIRQLALGCKHFVILEFALVWEDDQSARASYRNTLVDHGISPDDIQVVRASNCPENDNCTPFANAEGVWANHLFLLHVLRPYIEKQTSLKKLHVDGIGFYEFFKSIQVFCRPFYQHENRPLDLNQLYGSSGIKLYSLRKLGALAIERTQQLLDTPDMPRIGVEYVDWLTPKEETLLQKRSLLIGNN